MPYIIARNKDGKYVSKPGSTHSYTSSLAQAEKYANREAALAAKCENEHIVDIQQFTK